MVSPTWDAPEGRVPLERISLLPSGMRKQTLFSLVGTSTSIACLALSATGCSGASGASVGNTASELSATSIDIGFAGAKSAPASDPFQFGAMQRFWGASSGSSSPRLCHIYLSWDIGLKYVAQQNGDASTYGTPAYFTSWLQNPKNPCTDVLVTFQAQSVGGVPGVSPTDFRYVPGCDTCYGTAFKQFLDSFTPVWATGAGRVFSFTAWNEPNNGSPSGNGTNQPLTPDSAAQYYLVARSLCGSHASRCKVAAGDMASDGGMVGDFPQRCSSDIDATLCAQASWLDKYKHFIAFHATDPAFQLPGGFRPEYWAYHPWYDINSYVYDGKDCTDEATCSTMAFAHTLGGSWAGATIWDTEIGSGQDSSKRPNGGALDDKTQARGAAYLLDLSTKLTSRISRIYYMGVETGAWQVLCANGNERPSFDVLAKRETTYGGAETDACSSAGSGGGGAPSGSPTPSSSGGGGASGPSSFASIAGAATNADGRVELFAVGSDGFMYHQWQTVPGSAPWSGWTQLSGNTFVSGSGVARNADGRLEVFGVSSADHGMWHTWQVTAGGAWNQTSSGESWWYPLGGTFTAGVGAARNQDGRLEVFGIGGGGAMYHTWQTTAGGGWAGWSSLGGSFDAGVGAVTNADGRLEVLGLGGGGAGGGSAMYRLWQSSPGGGWAGSWASLGGGFLMGTGVAANADGRLEAFGVGNDDATWHYAETAAGQGWNSDGWSSLGGANRPTPSVAGATTNADGRVEIFTIDGSGGVQHSWQVTAGAGDWSGWSAL